MYICICIYISIYIYMYVFKEIYRYNTYIFIYKSYIYIYNVYIFMYIQIKTVCSVTSKRSQSISRRVSSFKDSSTLLIICEVNLTKIYIRT